VHPSLKVAVAATALCACAAPSAAQAATKSVFMGTPPSSQKAIGEQQQSDANAFFPKSVAIHVGDKVKFAPVGFHTADFVAKGKKPAPLVSPTGQKAVENDAAGNPFWFTTAGMDALSFTPSLANGLFGKSVTFDNTKNVESGLPLADKPKPFTITFKKAGSFTYLCDVHPGMKGTVKVLPKSKPVPSAKADAKALKAQVDAALKTAKALANTTSPANTISVGASGAGGIERFAFFPNTLTVPTGTTVTFKMSPKSYDLHTATTGPGDPEKEPTSYLGKLSASLQSPAFDPAAIYPSDQPGAPASLTPTSHGNGFWGSGFMDASSATPTLPASNAVMFAAPGTYTFYCLIHPFMKATVTAS
jgi:plastocyanin